MTLSLILAQSENRVLGRDNDLPWHLPADLKRFKKLTVGHTMVMGRKTWESIGRPLPRRRSLVLSRDPDFWAEGAEVFRDLDEALAAQLHFAPFDGGQKRFAERHGRNAAPEEIFVIGGASLFAESLPRADRLYLTWVHADVEGDVFCPELDLSAFKRIESTRHQADARHDYPFTFETWHRLDGHRSDGPRLDAAGPGNGEGS